MNITVKSLFNYISYGLIMIIICAMYAINDNKEILYFIKIFFIIFMAFQFIIMRYKFTKYSIWSITFLVICGASIMWATNQDSAIFNFIWTLQTLLITSLVEPFIKDKKKLEFLLKCFIVGGLLLIIRLLIETPLDTWGTIRVGSSIGYNENDVGLKLAFSALCATYFIGNRKKKILLVIVTIILASFTMLSGSRKAFFIIFFGPVLYFILNMKNKKRILLYVPVLLTLLFGVYYLITNVEMFYNVLGYRVESMLGTYHGNNTSAQASTDIRVGMIYEGFSLFLKKPFLGYGIGNYTNISSFRMYAHNNYIELLTGVGIIGFIAYYSIYIFIFKNLIKEYLSGNKEFSFPITLVLIIAVSEFGLVSYNTSYLHILLVICFSYLHHTRINTVHNTIKQKNRN